MYQRPYRRHEERLIDFGIRIDLPEFAGTLDAEGFIDWLNDLELFEYKDIPDHAKVKLLAIKLKGRDSDGWEQLRRSRNRQSKSKITDWAKMKKKMRDQFLPLG